MWAQTWQNLYDDTRPYRNAPAVDATAKLKQLNYNALKMFETSDEFYQSLGLESNRMSYTGDSIIEKPSNRTIQCHASAWDLCDGKDFRIKMCTNINQEDLFVIHHEMGMMHFLFVLVNVELIRFFHARTQDTYNIIYSTKSYHWRYEKVLILVFTKLLAIPWHCLLQIHGT